MINNLFYAVLVAGFLSTVLSGRKDLIYAIAFVMPASQVMPSPLGTVSTPLYLMVGGLWLASRRFPDFARDPSEPTPLRAPLLLFIGCIVIGLAIRGISTLQGAIYLNLFWDYAVRGSWYLICLFLLYRLVYRAATPNLNVDRVVTIVQISFLVQVAVAVFEKASGAGRACAQLGEDNVAGGFFAGATAFFLAWFLMGNGKRRWLSLGAAAFSIFGVFATLSRGGMLSSIVAIVVVSTSFFLAVPSRAGTKAIFLIIILLFVGNGALLLPTEVKERVLFTFKGEKPSNLGEVKLDQSELEGSSAARLEFWELAWDFYKVQPWGFGPYTFPTLLYQRVDSQKQTHSIFFQTLVELGTQGIIALIGIMIAVYVRLFRVFSECRNSFRGALALALIGWWTAHIVAHVFLNSFFQSQSTGQFWILLAIALAPIGSNHGLTEAKVSRL